MWNVNDGEPLKAHLQGEGNPEGQERWRRFIEAARICAERRSSEIYSMPKWNATPKDQSSVLPVRWAVANALRDAGEPLIKQAAISLPTAAAKLPYNVGGHRTPEARSAGGGPCAATC